MESTCHAVEGLSGDPHFRSPISFSIGVCLRLDFEFKLQSEDGIATVKETWHSDSVGLPGTVGLFCEC